MEIREKSVMARLTFYLDSFSSMFAFYRGSAMLGTSPKISNKSFNEKVSARLENRKIGWLSAKKVLWVTRTRKAPW